MSWNVSRLYPSYDDPTYAHDWKQLEQQISAQKKWSSELDSASDLSQTLLEYIRNTEAMSQLIYKLFAFSQFQLAINVQDETSQKKTDLLQKQMEELTVPETQFIRWIKDKDLSIIHDHPELNPFEWFFNRKQEEGQYMLSDREEELLTKLKKTGSHAWARLQQSLTSLASGEIVDEQGVAKSMPLMSIRNLAFDERSEMRKQAFEVENTIYAGLEESVGACLNHIKGEMITETEWRGYPTLWSAISRRHRIEHDTVMSMMQAVKEQLPRIQPFYQIKAKCLGYDKALPIWDLYAPLGKLSTSYPFSEAKTIILEVFGSFDPAMKEMAEKAFTQDWIDVEPKKGKRGGAFCANVYALKESRILLNYDSTQENLITLAHELGHAYHNVWLMENSIVHLNSPLSLAETASTFNEHLLQGWLMNHMDADQRLIFLDKKIQRVAAVIVDIYSRFVFEQAVMDRRKDGALSVREIKELMSKAQLEAYGEGLDPKHHQPMSWINKPHYYIPELHFYNFPYTLGCLISLYLYRQYLEQGQAFLPMYQKFLGRCGYGSVEEITASVGIDLRSGDFMKSTFDLIEKDIIEFRSLSEKQS